MSPISVLYPKGNLFFVEQNYTRLGDPLGDVYYNMYCQFICRFAKRMAAPRGAENPLRILECGAGMGLVTRQLLPKLKKINGRIQYYFTDLGKAFVENARKTFSGTICEREK
jgi:SAM-dependent MidA family methyltransferase